jgi:starch phosphorylase
MHVMSNSPLGAVAYFSMEVGLEPGIPTYSGGLGILAGDALRSAAVRRPRG